VTWVTEITLFRNHRYRAAVWSGCFPSVRYRGLLLLLGIRRWLRLLVRRLLGLRNRSVLRWKRLRHRLWFLELWPRNQFATGICVFRSLWA